MTLLLKGSSKTRLLFNAAAPSLSSPSRHQLLLLNRYRMGVLRTLSSSKQPPRKNATTTTSTSTTTKGQKSNNNSNNLDDKQQAAKATVPSNSTIQSSSSSSSLSSKPRSNPSRFRNVRKKEYNNKNLSLAALASPPVMELSNYSYDVRRNRLLLNDIVAADRVKPTTTSTSTLYSSFTLSSSLTSPPPPPAPSILSSSTLSPRLFLPIMNASALLDPKTYCKTSAKHAALAHGVHPSISGTDAARRLLRGKKEFCIAARQLKTPAILTGHGVPHQLFQHVIDMADALLVTCSKDTTGSNTNKNIAEGDADNEEHAVAECTFHNFYRGIKLPQHLRIRSRDATNRCSPWPPPNSIIEDWDYHLTLYLTVMERLAGHLGRVLQQQPRRRKPNNTSSTTNNNHVPSSSLSFSIGGADDTNVEDNDDDVTTSPFLFPNSTTTTLQWKVDILRGSYYDLQDNNNNTNNNNTNSAVCSGGSGNNGIGSTANTNSTYTGNFNQHKIPPFPIVEFTQDSGTTGHILIRIQGYALPNPDFGSERSDLPVTLVFDACFQNKAS